MRKLTKQYVFQRVYDMAALVESCVENNDSFQELSWDDPEFLSSLIVYSKVTVLHAYIFAMIAVEHRYDYRKNADIFEEAPELIADVEALLRAYDIDFIPFEEFKPLISIDVAQTREEYPFHQWFLTQENKFDQLWEKMTDEVFYLLFGNRAFLLKFNTALASWIQKYKPSLPVESVKNNGTIKRASMPKWVRDAVFFRDHGRCVFCRADLSGLLSLDRIDHFDHIVPLAAGGINDPTNVQLLCEACNLKKSDGDARTGLRYPAWWPE